MMMSLVASTAWTVATLVTNTLATVAATMMMTAVTFFAAPLVGQLRSTEFLEQLADLRRDTARDPVGQIEIFWKPEVAVLMRGDDAIEEGACA